ncbi:zinc finger, CCHC-type containing protein [Tanacetum coccineum]
MIDSRPVMEQFNELLRILRQYTQHGLKINESISVSSIIDKLPPPWKDFKHTLKHDKDDLSLVQISSHLRIKESLRAHDSDKGKGKEVDEPSMNMTEEGKNKNIKKTKERNVVSKRTTLVLVPTRNLSWNVGSVVRLVTSRGIAVVVDAIAWWIDSGATTHVCKERCWFKTYEPVEDIYVLYMGDDHFAPVHGKGRFDYYNNGMFMLKLNKVPDHCGSVYTSSSTIVNFSLWHARLGHVRYRRMFEMSKDDLITAIDENPKKAYRFYVIEPNDSVSINSIIESRDAIFDENCFSSILRLKDIIPNSVESQRDDHYDDIPSETPKPRKGKRVRKAKSYGYDFQLYLVEGSRDQVGSQYSYCYSIEEDPRTYNEAMQSLDAAFWKEAIGDEIGYIMENNTWILSDLPPSYKPLSCKWIFKRKMKVDGTIDKFKARLVIQGFKQKEGIDYFDTYAIVARITTIRLLLALAAIHNLVIHQMDVKIVFLNGDLDEEVYMKQLEGFVMLGNEHKVCKLVKWLYGLKQAPKQWHQKFDEVVLSSGFLLNQSDKCVYSKFDSSGKGVIICLYGDDMLIFGTDQNQVDKTKKFLSSKFSMKDMGETDVILGIKIKRENKGIGIQVLEVTMNYGLLYVGYPSVLEAYSNASWINHVEDSSSTSGWVFLLRGGAISWASKKQMCITGSTMEYEFIALVTADKEAEWLRNLIHEIPIWPEPIAPISIRCDSTATLAKVYSQIYNGKSRHLGVRHSMIRELIRNSVISIEFVRSQHNLANYLTKGLARDLVIKTNLRRIQVKDIVKEVEDYLKIYSSAEMDISWYVEGIRYGSKESQMW